MPRRRVAVALAAVLVVAAASVAAMAVLRDEPRRRPAAVDAPRGQRLARAACADLVRFEEQVGANAEGDDVLATLETARQRAMDAADNDPRWRSLASGTEALDVALRHDDPEAARVGIDVVRAQCQQVS